MRHSARNVVEVVGFRETATTQQVSPWKTHSGNFPPQDNFMNSRPITFDNRGNELPICVSPWLSRYFVQDLYLGLALMALFSAGAFALGIRLARGHRWVGNGLAIATVLLTILYVRFIWDDIRLARLLPFSNLVIVGNCLPLMSTFLAGIVWHRIHHWRRVFGVAALWIAGSYAACTPLLELRWQSGTSSGIPRLLCFIPPEVPACEDNWTDIGICLQTTPATCTPACAATLLKIHGIATTEGEMARLCLTSSQGTNWVGLYRGLKLKTRGTQLDVAVLSGSAEDLLKNLPGPCIISVGLPLDTRSDSFYRTKWVWNPGEEHSVIILGYTEEGLLQIIDPIPHIEYETWRTKDLAVLWRGQGMALIRRKSSR